MTQSTGAVTPEEILKKHYEIFVSKYPKENMYSWDEILKEKTTLEILIPAMQEYAALTSPASGWVKVESEKDLPEGEVLYEYENEDGKLVTDRGFLLRHYFVQKYYRYLRYLSETPLPSVEECMEYASQFKVLSDMPSPRLLITQAVKSIIEYAQTGLKQL